LQFLKEIMDDKVEFYWKQISRYGHESYERIEELCRNDWRLTIGTIEVNRRVQIESIFPIICPLSEVDKSPEFTT